jgi:glycosyltransferase involved in cell wall biosynthesis
MGHPELDKRLIFRYDQPMKASIIIPAKNEESVLPKLFATIKEQHFTDYEVILADAFSTDASRALAEAFGVRVVDGGMPGPGRNRGAEAAQGEILVFMDADVELPSTDYLVDVLAEFDACGADVATCRLDPMSERFGDQLGHAFYNRYTKLTERVLPHAPGSCIIVRRDVHAAIGGFDERVVFAEDMEYVQRAHKSGYRFRVMESHPIRVSVRRLDKDGRLRVMVKYIYGEVRMRIKGPFKDHMPFDYEFANFERKE